MFGIMPLKPAYGRDYKSAKAVKADWDDGKDFQTVGGQYTSKRDWTKGHLIEVRYDGLRKQTEFKA